MKVKTFAIAALFVVGGALGAGLHAQDGRTTPTAEIEEPPRTFEEIGHQRGGATSDSAVPGWGSGAPRYESRITIPDRCDVDPALYGCPLFCDYNPSDAICQTPDPGEPGGDGDPTPNPGPGEPMWCGLPYWQWPDPHPGSELHGQDKCSPVQGGWYCGNGLHWYCP